MVEHKYLINIFGHGLAMNEFSYGAVGMIVMEISELQLEVA